MSTYVDYYDLCHLQDRNISPQNDFLHIPNIFFVFSTTVASFQDKFHEVDVEPKIYPDLQNEHPNRLDMPFL